MIDTWIQTYSGEKVNPFNPDPSTINIEDIAHALSNLCRFTGHTSRFYSVAEHSWWVSKLVVPEHALYGLLHDSSEAYLADISRPVKPYLNNYKKTEKGLQSVIFKKFGLSPEPPRDVKNVDSRLCFTEGIQLMPDVSCWNLQREPYKDVLVRGWLPVLAKTFFMDRFKELI